MKSIVNKFMKAILDELFIDAGNVQMSMGPDLFSESTIHLKNLTFRPDIFDVCLQPLHLISGHLGKLSVDGIAELALGAGKIGCQVENIFLLFGVDENAERTESAPRRDGSARQRAVRRHRRATQGAGDADVNAVKRT